MDRTRIEGIELTVQTTRRSILTATVVGSGMTVGMASLPRQWTRPVINSVVLPAHAQTTASAIDFALEFTVFCDFTTNDNGVLDLLIDSSGIVYDRNVGVIDSSVGDLTDGAVVDARVVGNTTSLQGSTSREQTTISTQYLARTDIVNLYWTIPPPTGRIWTRDDTGRFTGLFFAQLRDENRFGETLIEVPFECRGVFDF